MAKVCILPLAGWLLAGTLLSAVLNAQDRPQTPQGQQGTAAARNIGVLKSISGNTLVLKTDAGPEITISVPDGTRIVRLAPGQADLKNAPAATLPELQVGDRMLVRSRPGDNGVVVATTVVVMKQADVAQKQQHDREDWQKRGAGGIVSSVDMAAGTINVSVNPALSIVVKTTRETGFLRYAPGSIKFSDAQKGTMDQIKTGDQIRARGNRSADGKELTAEEVISGAFRNIAGTITSIDAANNAITVKDVLAKKSVVIKFNADSQLRKLAPQMAQRLAFFLKSGAQGQGGPPADGQTPTSGAAPAGNAPAPGGNGQGGNGSGGNRQGPRPGGAPDFQQMLSRIPTVTLADLQKEDAVMVVATQADGGEVIAVTLLGGVEPILTASPNGMGAAALFSGWNMGTPGGDAGPQ